MLDMSTESLGRMYIKNEESLYEAVEKARQIRGVSDVHIDPNEQIGIRVDGTMQVLPSDSVPSNVISDFVTRAISASEVSPAAVTSVMNVLNTRKAYTVMVRDDRMGCVRVHIMSLESGYSLAIRLLPESPPDLYDIGLPIGLAERLLSTSQGAAFIGGPLGSGKSHTLAALTEALNVDAKVTIATLDGVIEFRYHRKRATVRQIRVGPGGVPSYKMALEDLLRSDSDIIIVGECRDPESLQAVLNIAMAGRRVITTVHIESATSLPDRIVGAFPPDIQPEIRTQLSQTLQEVVYQRLVPLASGEGRALACEVLTRTDTLGASIRKMATDNSDTSASSASTDLLNMIRSNRGEGMMTMEDALVEMVATNDPKRRITTETALRFAVRPVELKATLIRDGYLR